MPQPAFESPSFPLISKQTLANILSWDDLKCDETSVFQAAIDWATKALHDKKQEASVNNIKQVLGEAIKLIRFPTMPFQKFVDIWEKYPNILEPSVYVDILSYTMTKKPLTAACEFNIQRRDVEEPPPSPSLSSDGGEEENEEEEEEETRSDTE